MQYPVSLEFFYPFFELRDDYNSNNNNYSNNNNNKNIYEEDLKFVAKRNIYWAVKNNYTLIRPYSHEFILTSRRRKMLELFYRLSLLYSMELLHY